VVKRKGLELGKNPCGRRTTLDGKKKGKGGGSQLAVKVAAETKELGTEKSSYLWLGSGRRRPVENFHPGEKESLLALGKKKNNSPLRAKKEVC